eukprot:2780912-Prymnesium_polylepis.1
MYSAVKAEVVDPADSTTALNLALIDQLQMRQGAIVFAGEAASHCVNYTVSAPPHDSAKRHNLPPWGCEMRCVPRAHGD